MPRTKLETNQQFQAKNTTTSTKSTILLDLVENAAYNNNVSIVETTIPVVTSGSRVVHQVTFPNRAEVDRAFIGFKFAPNINASLLTGSYAPLAAATTNQTALQQFTTEYPIGCTYLIYTDYQKAIRVPVSNNNNYYSNDEVNPRGEIFNVSGSAFSLKFPLTYTNLGNFLHGYYYYSFTGAYQSVFFAGDTSKVLLESMWFTTNNNDLVLNIALKNYSAGSSSTRLTQVYMFIK